MCYVIRFSPPDGSPARLEGCRGTGALLQAMASDDDALASRAMLIRAYEMPQYVLMPQPRHI